MVALARDDGRWDRKAQEQMESDWGVREARRRGRLGLRTEMGPRWDTLFERPRIGLAGLLGGRLGGRLGGSLTV